MMTQETINGVNYIIYGSAAVILITVVCSWVIKNLARWYVNYKLELVADNLIRDELMRLDAKRMVDELELRIARELYLFPYWTNKLIVNPIKFPPYESILIS